MSDLNYRFFEEFKKLDKLCREIYGEKSDGRLAVSLYLDDMAYCNLEGSRHIEGWNEDFRRLKQLRGLRNSIAHEVNVGETCSQSDVDFIILFRERILNGTDPLALLRKEKQRSDELRRTAAQSRKTAVQSAKSAPVYNTHKKMPTKKPRLNESYEERGSSFGFIAAVVISLAVILTVLILSNR